MWVDKIMQDKSPWLFAWCS